MQRLHCCFCGTTNLPCRAHDPFCEAFHAPVHPLHAWLFKEAEQLEIRSRSVLVALQFLPDSFSTLQDTSTSGGTNRPPVDNWGIADANRLTNCSPDNLQAARMEAKKTKPQISDPIHTVNVGIDKASEILFAACHRLCPAVRFKRRNHSR